MRRGKPPVSVPEISGPGSLSCVAGSLAEGLSRILAGFIGLETKLEVGTLPSGMDPGQQPRPAGIAEA